MPIRQLILVLLLPALSGVAPLRSAEDDSMVDVRWLHRDAPAVEQGVSWGVPWPRGKLAAAERIKLTDASGASVPVQTWPLAYWPDGSLKWTGHAIVAQPGMPDTMTLSPGSWSAPESPISTVVDPEQIVVDTGFMHAVVNRTGLAIFASLTIGEREVARDGRLLVMCEDVSDYVETQTRRDDYYVGRVDRVEVEQTGPVRAVLKLTGVHRSMTTDREFLPFTVRLYFFAGSGEVKMVHSFIFDGDQQKDFIKGLGVTFDVPLVEEPHNRHVRFAGDEGMWVQPVQLIPGYRSQAGQRIVDLYADHLAGRRIPELGEFEDQERNAIQSVAVYNDFRLSQVGPNGFAIDKRTDNHSSWLHVTDGNRSPGLAVLGDVSGGLAVGLKDFWQKYPSSIEISGAAEDVGHMNVWFWSPDAEPMDLRHYDDGPHGLPINYEDWKPGWSTAEGIANTSELTLRAFDAIPSSEELVGMAAQISAPATLVCAPEYYHSVPVFGQWSLPDRSSPTLRWVEDQVEGLVDFYRGQVEERQWYGFWNYGDIMHHYDFGRHEWRYDIGGWAWVGTELMPDMLLWYTFLRTGRPDVHAMAAAMTRHTSEVDVHHSGPFAPMGSRHNVKHWGDGAKQPRISQAGLKRFHYYLTTDERVGDLMREQIDADYTYDYLVQFNPSHYVPTEDGGYELDGRRAVPALRPEEFDFPERQPRERATRLSFNWMIYGMNWMTEWERTGDPFWRDHLLADMRAMVANARDERFNPGRFGMLFGSPENMYQMEPMLDVPEFWAYWANTSAEMGRNLMEGSRMTAPRLLAYGAMAKDDEELGKLAWESLVGDALVDGVPEVVVSRLVDDPGLAKPVHDPVFLGESVGWQLHGPASIHWALNAIETMAMAKEYLPAWEAERLGGE